ncbi:MAG: hypothetical protein ABIP61_05880, partial [Burkholderiaceae bacterium]
RVGGAEVDGQISREVTPKGSEHGEAVESSRGPPCSHKGSATMGFSRGGVGNSLRRGNAAGAKGVWITGDNNATPSQIAPSGAIYAA